LLDFSEPLGSEKLSLPYKAKRGLDLKSPSDHESPESEGHPSSEHKYPSSRIKLPKPRKVAPSLRFRLPFFPAPYLPRPASGLLSGLLRVLLGIGEGLKRFFSYLSKSGIPSFSRTYLNRYLTIVGSQSGFYSSAAWI